MTYYTETPHDMEVRYEGCYGILPDKTIFRAYSFYRDEEDSIMMVYHPLVTSNSKYINSKTLVKTNGFFHEIDKYKVKLTPDNNLFPIPNLGFITLDFYSLYLYRKHKKSSPARYRRGFRYDLIDYDCFDSQELSKLSTSINNDYLSIINAIFNPKYFEFNEALNLLLNGERISCALSPSICIKIDSNRNTLILYKNNWVIADYSSRQSKFLLRYKKCNLIEEELKSLGVVI